MLIHKINPLLVKVSFVFGCDNIKLIRNVTHAKRATVTMHNLQRPKRRRDRITLVITSLEK